jgi:hypothetical protein
MQYLEEQYGAVVSAAQLAASLGLATKTVRSNYKKWGGVQVGNRKVIFFEREVARRLAQQTSCNMEDGSDNGNQTKRRLAIVSRRPNARVANQIDDPFGLLPQKS